MTCALGLENMVTLGASIVKIKYTNELHFRELERIEEIKDCTDSNVADMRAALGVVGGKLRHDF